MQLEFAVFGFLFALFSVYSIFAESQTHKLSKALVEAHCPVFDSKKSELVFYCLKFIKIIGNCAQKFSCYDLIRPLKELTRAFLDFCWNVCGKMFQISQALSRSCSTWQNIRYLVSLGTYDYWTVEQIDRKVCIELLPR